MHWCDILIYIGLTLSSLAGLVSGHFASSRNISLIRRILYVVLILFTADIIIGLFVAHSHRELAVAKTIIFYFAVSAEFYALFSLGCAICLLFKKTMRKAGLVLLLLSLTPVPISAILVGIGKMFMKR